MSMTANDYPVLLSREFKDAGNTTLLTLLPRLFDMYAERGAVGGARLQYLYARRHALELLVHASAPNFSWKEADVSEDAGDEFKAWVAARGDVQAEIAIIEARLTAGQAGMVGAITNTAPLTTAAGGLGRVDPNDRRFMGDPFRRTSF